MIVPKGERRLEGFDDRIVSLYARGMTVREIRGHLEELYGVAVSPDLISRVTDAVLEEVREWQNRPLDPVYPVVFFDALRVKIRDEGLVRNKAVYLALAITSEGDKEVLGLWIEQTEGAKFWLKVMNELRTRGLHDILIAVVDGLTGFPDAIGTVFPRTTVQTCIVHLIPNSLAFVSWKDRKKVMPDLKAVYRAESAEAAAARLDEFEARWGQRYPAVVPAWRRAWEHVVPMFAFPPAIRKMIYTTNALESLNRSLRKIIKTRGSFPATRRRRSCCSWPSAIPGSAGGALLTGSLPWGNLQSCSRTASRPQLAEPGMRNAHGAAYTEIRTYPDALAQHRLERHRHLAGGQPQHEARQDHLVDMRRPLSIGAYHPQRTEPARARHPQLDLPQLRHQPPPVTAVTPVRFPSLRHLLQMTVAPPRHALLQHPLQRQSPGTAVVLAPLNLLRSHLLQHLKRLQYTLDRCPLWHRGCFFLGGLGLFHRSTPLPSLTQTLVHHRQRKALDRLRRVVLDFFYCVLRTEEHQRRVLQARSRTDTPGVTATVTPVPSGRNRPC